MRLTKSILILKLNEPWKLVFFLKRKCYLSNKRVSKWRENKETFCNGEGKIYDCHWCETWNYSIFPLNDGKLYKNFLLVLSRTLCQNKEGSDKLYIVLYHGWNLTQLIAFLNKRLIAFRAIRLHPQWTVKINK